MKMKRLVSLVSLVMLLCLNVNAATILQYDFEDGTAETPMNDTGTTEQVGSVDISGNGNDMFAWDDYWGPMSSSLGETATGVGLSSEHDGHRDGYTLSSIYSWSPSTWTIELSFKLDDISSWRTLVGRDGWAQIDGTNIDVGAALYIQKNDENQAIRLDFATVSGERYHLDSTLVPVAEQWYRFAIVADGDQIDMYADQLDGNGFQNVGTHALTEGLDHALLPTGNWTFGRGWWNGNFGDHIVGNLDDIRFSDQALTTDQFIPEPATLALLGLGTLMLRRKRK